jgi:pimeloyl-ACP methyl ester carboxylesterase
LIEAASCSIRRANWPADNNPVILRRVREAGRLTARAAGGRDLEVFVDGTDRGAVHLFHAGTPSAAIRYGLVVDPAAKHGLRTVTYSRPGYAESTPQHGRYVADAAPDSEAVLDALGADRFVTLGGSGGGPHALACAALLAERCMAAATMASVARYPAAGLDWFAGMDPRTQRSSARRSRARYLQRRFSRKALRSCMT